MRAFGEGDSDCQLLCLVLRPLVNFEAVSERTLAVDDEGERRSLRDVAHVVELRNLRHHDGEIRKRDQVDESVAGERGSAAKQPATVRTRRTCGTPW